ncbi:MAG TPA: AAA family ATPase [Vicinamibacterales bacterium]|nr:AAA family ATPase [Vicinamibacterales bacterium]
MSVSPAVQSEQVRLAFDVVNVLEREIGSVVVGQQALTRRLLTSLFAAIPYAYTEGEIRYGCGHVLLEGVPGVAKTLMATSIAQAISARFQRIQLTPDMLPADIIGTRIYDATTASFRTEPGPVFTNILLADEINRATPKTQSALLEAMQERQVTLADSTRRLDDPFWVLATQNPIEQEGVYALPEAQLDRFSLMLRVGYPSADDELQMLRVGAARMQVERRITPAEVVQVRELVREAVHVDDRLREYIVRLGRATRTPQEFGRPGLAEMIVAGLSPRSYQHVLALARVNAFLEGRTYVLPADVKALLPDAARHRVVRSLRAEAEGITTDALLEELLRAVPIP